MPWIKFHIDKCRQCPFTEIDRTQGAGFAWDRYCTRESNDGHKSKIKVGGYIEWESEEPEVPSWCPIKVDE